MRAHSSYFRRKNSKKGLALSTTMAICIVLSILVALLVSMATLNITTTQATVNQREAYIQAKSALSFAESYYYQNGDSIPGSGNVGEGLIVFKTDNIADGASFYETKTGTTVLIDDATVEQYKKDCPNTYITVKNSLGLTDSLLTLTAYTKYGNDDAYMLSKEFTIGGHTNVQDNAFTGSINYQTTNQTRYVRFHVRATSALGGAPYFYMWYNQVSPKEGQTGYNAWATSSIENKLTFNRYYGTVENGSWDRTGPKGACAMSYEGDGWCVTQKTFNLTRNLHFVNGIITKTGATRSAGDDQQSWEFFGIPIPDDEQLGAGEGVDVYFELNKNELKDMKNTTNSYGSKADAFSETYRSFAHNGDAGHRQLTDFVRYCSEYYTVYTKSDTAIMHYRLAGDTTAEHPVGGFTYEGYGWWRSTSHNFSDSFSGYSYGNGTIISQNQYGKERVVESFVVEDADGNTAQFGSEEEANAWLIKRGDLSAGNYVEVNVKSAQQPVDPNDNPGAKISYDAVVYEGTEKVPSYDTSIFAPTSAADAPEPTELGKTCDVKLLDLANAVYGDFYLVGNMNNWGEEMSWNDLGDDVKLTSNGDGRTYSIEYDVAAGSEVSFFVIQKPDNVYVNIDDYGRTYKDKYFQPLTEYQTDIFAARGEYGAFYERYGRGSYGLFRSLTNIWGVDSNNPVTFSSKTNKVLITFDITNNQITYDDEIGINDRPNNGGNTEVTTDSTYSVIGWMNDWGTKQDGMTSTDGTALYSLTRTMQMYSDVDGVLTYSDGTLVVESGKEYKFKIAERQAGIDEDHAIDWTRVYNKDGTNASSDPAVAAGDDENAVLIQPPLNSDGKPAKYYVTITFGPSEENEGRLTPGYILTEFDDIDKYYVVGEFNGWDSNEDVKNTYDFNQVYPYELVQVNSTKNDVIFQYKIDSVKEAGHYEIMVVGSHSSKLDDDNNMVIDYEKAWGANSDTNLTEDGGRISMGGEPKSYDLAERSNVLITFTYHKNDPTTSEITVTPTPIKTDETVERVHVGFHNAKLENVNDSKKNSKFETPWENVYVTYYTEETGFNCFLAKKADEGLNWWADVPVDAEYVYFSNKRTNVYNELHSKEFEYTVDIKNEEFAGSESTIFFPITPEKDKEERTRWTVGDSQDYFEYVNKRTHVSENDADMAYYGSTQCNYYDAPFVNVLNMILTGDPKPSRKYAYSSYPWGSYGVNGHTLRFSSGNVIYYQGEAYYWCDITSWKSDSSFMLVNNPKETKYNENGSNMYSFLFEDQMSLETNGNWWDAYGTRTTGDYLARKDGTYYWTNSNGINGFLYMDDRAGGVFVSDTHYRNGSESPFNYQGYTPSWYTYRIPVSNDVTIKNVKIVTKKNTWANVVNNNTTSFAPIRQSTNVNRPVYFYRTSSGDTQSYTYNINQGVVDGITDSSGNVKVSVYFDNTENWDKVSLYASDPIGGSTYQTLSVDNTTPDNNYYKFEFKEGQYTFFQFFDGNASADGLKDAEHKTSPLYLTGEELGSTSDMYLDEYSGMDKRTTRILAKGDATGFTWYMHPRMQIMRAYLDMDTVTNMTTETSYYAYDSVQGVYHCYDNVSMSSFSTKRNTLKNWYNNGNSGGKWTASGLESYGDGLLEAAQEFMAAVSEARIYVSEDIADAPTNSTTWFGNDPDYMVFLEGEQIQDSAFEYTSRWKAGLKNVYKRIMKTSYHLSYEDGTYALRATNNPNCVYTNASLQNAAQFRQYAADLRLWLDNPQATIKRDAVRVIVDDSRKTIGRFTRGGWGKESIHLYVKDPDNGWTAFSSDICSTTQKNFYAFVFMLPATDKYYNAEFAISPSMPVEVSEEITNADGTKSTITRDMVDGVEITKMKITSGNQYRFNTCYSLDDPKCFTVDTSVETKSYAGTEITKGDNSPTSELNQFIGMTVGKKFVINFKYDTTVNYDGQSYKIFAGAYTIDDKYSGFYTDFAPGATKETATKSGIDLYTENAKKFFTQKNNEGYMNYGVKSATGYSPWATNKVNSGKDLDIMTNNISKTGDVVASEKDNRVNFRYNGEKGSDTLKVDRNITLKGSVISIAANVIDFRSSGAADFTIESGTFIFLTDTEIKKADGTTSVINHGTYVFNTKNTDKKTMKVSLKSTSDPETDWRSKFSLVSDIGSELEGGKFIANN